MTPLYFVAATVALVGTSPRIATDKAQQSEVISYRCSDVVVVGTIQNVEGSYEHIEIEDDILGHGWMTAYVKIKRVLRGRETRSAVHAKYFEHAQIMFKPRQRYLVILRPTDEGLRIVRPFHQWNERSRSNLAKACE